ncbi:reverse transcriptase [Microseira wollei NIES-4236]|uniref:Reverse transcriptase n=1 Tax=Microseira wollei NIES-4236 TaxID=2530354 RepID=A0AAV3XNR0_9CYAN|nr:hypothetical protein [Microseira wollei]GET44164.1 reverse transcriptase [Microseira wollei NIES-4236]
MRTAATILNIIRERGQGGLPIEDVYRLLYNRDLYLRAYAKHNSNAGAITPGATPETVDGMSLEKINTIIDALRYERYRWTPARRTYIPKKNGKHRPLGMPSWSDKLLQEVIRSILEAYYEPQCERTFPRFSTTTRMSYSTGRNYPKRSSYKVVYRRRYLWVF